MSQATRLLSPARAPIAPDAIASRGGWLLAAALASGAAALGLVAWGLAQLLGRFDTLGYLLEETHAVQRGHLRLLLVAAASTLLVLASVALISRRGALASLGGAFLLAGALAGPLARAWLAPAEGLEESLIYRLRGFAAIGVIGGLLLLFLSGLPRRLDLPPGALERRIGSFLGRGLARLAAISPIRRRILIGGLAFVLAGAVALLILQDFPNSSDESSYLTQARIFASGRLWVEAPQRPEFFRARSFILDETGGRFFAKAFPGWAAILALGVIARAPWAVNPALSAAALILAGWAGGRLLGRHGELAVVGMIAASPFFVLNGASYFNHPATVLLITLFLAAVIRLHEGAGIVWGSVAGLAIGAALWIRPAPAMVLTIPLIAWLGAGWVKERRWGLLAASILPVVCAVAGIGAYDRMMFGSIWQTGYGAYDPADIRPGLGWDHLAITGWWLLKLCFWLVPGSVAGLWLLVRGRRFGDWFRREPILALMLLSLVLLLAAYLIFQNKGGNEYGPRYYYDGITYLAILMCAGWMRVSQALDGRVAPARARRGAALVLGAGALLALAGSVPFLSLYYRDKVSHNRDLYTTVERAGIEPALVFLATDSGRMPPGDLVRNPLDFRSGVVYARDLGLEADRELAALYPDRPALLYAYDPRARRSTLSPIGPGGRP